MPTELDLVIRDFAVPVMQEHGFKKSGLTFRRKLDNGDWMVVQFSRYSLGVMGSFHLNVAFIAASVKAVEEIRHDDVTHPDQPPTRLGFRLRNIVPPRGVTWQYDNETQRARCGQQLQTRLTTAIAAMNALADHDVLFDVEFAPVEAAIPHARQFPDGGWGRLALLAERGPSPRLDQMVTTDPNLREAVRAWLDTRVTEPPAARRLDEYAEPARAFRQALIHHVDPVMADLGFSWTDTGYVRVSDRGDEALVDVTMSMMTSERQCVLYMGTGVRPHMSIRFDASRSHPASPFRLLWEKATVAPPRGRALTRPDVRVLGLRPWRVTLDPVDASAFDSVATALAGAAQRVVDLLDRDRLHASIDAVDTPYGYSPHPPTLARALLVADDPTHPRHQNAVTAVNLWGHGLAPHFVSWFKAQQAEDGQR